MPKKKENESWVARLKRKVQEHFAKKREEEAAFKATLKKVKGKKVETKKAKKKIPETKRTKDIKRQLRGSLSEADIKRLQGKKKK